MRNKIASVSGLLILAIFLCNGLIGWRPTFDPVNPVTVSKAIDKSLLLLEKTGYTFITKSRLKCVSCHHNTLLSMAADKAKRKGFTLVDSFTVHRVKAMVYTLTMGWDPNKPDEFVQAKFVGPYLLLGLYGENYPADVITDMSVDYMIRQQQPDGGFKSEAMRVPLESGEAHLTALTIRAIQLYAPAAKKRMVQEVVRKSKIWLEKWHDETQQELSFQLLGLYWCGSSREKIQAIANKLIALQRPDGGWAQLSTMKPDAYATGQALYALSETGVLGTDSEVYQRGLDYLLKTQDATGAWIMETRAYPIQPFFNSDFPPYDENQFISAAGTSWAVLAMVNALPDK